MASVETGSEVDLTGELKGPGARVALIANEYWPALLLIAFMACAFFLRLYCLSKHTEYTADSYYFLILTFQPAFLQWTSLPMTEGVFTFCFVTDSTANRKKLLNGFSGYIPPSYYEGVKKTGSFPSDEALDFLAV